MSERDEEIGRLVAELEVHLGEVEASVAVLKALLANDGEDSGGKTSMSS